MTRSCTALSERQARDGRGRRIGERMEQVGLRAAPGQDQDRVLQGRHAARLGRAHVVHVPGVHVPGPVACAPGTGRCSPGFVPAISKDALKKISAEVRSWRLHQHTGTPSADSRGGSIPIVRGWMQLLVRHEALLLRMEVKDRPSPCCRSSRVKLEAA